MPSDKNAREKLVKDVATESGWEVLDKGWPDFLLYDKRTKDVIFLEVKSCNGTGGGLTRYQKRLHKILKDLGLDVRVVRIGRKTGKKSESHKVAIKAITKSGLDYV